MFVVSIFSICGNYFFSFEIEMPYKLVRKKGGYIVQNTKTKKEYSSHPIPKKNAEAQLRLLNTLLSDGKNKA